MGQLTDVAAYFIRYVRKVLPEACRQLEIMDEMAADCIPASFIRNSRPADGSRAGRFSTGMLCSLLFSMVPDAGIKGFITFMLSLYTMDKALKEYRRNRGISDELEIRKLMGCLSAAADPSRSLLCELNDTSQIMPRPAGRPGPENCGTPVCHAEQCRLQLAVLPSFRLVSGKIKKYMQLYIDLQSYRHYPAVLSTDLLKTWSSNYLKRYSELTWWEFCACTDTFTGIAAMYAAASAGDAAPEEIKLLDEACFPWLCGFISMLDSVIGVRAALGTENMNFSSYYANLKECEERIIFFAERAETALSGLRGGSVYLHLMKIAAGLYLTDPEASFGMLRLARSSIIKKSSLQTYCKCSSLMRTFLL